MAPRNPETTRLSRASVVAVAFDLVEREGVEALSIRRLADALGVRGPSLYYHFSNKAELMESVVDAALEATLGAIDPADLGRGQGRDWRRWLERLAYTYRDILRSHRGLASLVALRLPTGPNGLAIYNATLAVLLKAGMTPRDALSAYVTVCDFVLASVQRELPRAAGGNGARWSFDELAELASAIADAPQPHPALAAVASEALRLNINQIFDYGIAALLDGIAARALREPVLDCPAETP